MAGRKVSAEYWSWEDWYKFHWDDLELSKVEIVHVGSTGLGTSGCTESVCGGAYKCRHCHKLFGWCYGAADELPDYCDDCWAECITEKTS